MKTDAEVCVCKHDSLLTTSFSIIYTNCTVSDNNFLHNVLSINVKVFFKSIFESCLVLNSPMPTTGPYRWTDFKGMV